MPGERSLSVGTLPRPFISALGVALGFSLLTSLGSELSSDPEAKTFDECGTHDRAQIHPRAKALARVYRRHDRHEATSRFLWVVKAVNREMW